MYLCIYVFMYLYLYSFRRTRNRLSSFTSFTSRCLALVTKGTPKSLEMEAPPGRRSTITVQVYPIGGNWGGRGGGVGERGWGFLCRGIGTRSLWY